MRSILDKKRILIPSFRRSHRSMSVQLQSGLKIPDLVVPLLTENHLDLAEECRVLRVDRHCLRLEVNNFNYDLFIQ